MSADVSLVVPLRAFSLGKTRLAANLTTSERMHLAEACARSVLCSPGVADIERFVVCDDEATAAWATSIGARAIRVTTSGLDASLHAAQLDSRCSTSTVIIAHGDLPLADRLVEDVDGLEPAPTDVLIVTDRHLDGTNVLVLPRSALGSWRFAYGPGSKERHAAEARRLGLAPRVATHPRLSIDLDTVEDLALPEVDTFVGSVLRRERSG